MNDVTQRKVLGFISLCRRAGRLTTGMDAAVEKAEKGEAHLLLLAQDLSTRSAARLRQKLPDIPVKYDGIPGGSRCTPAGTPLAGCCIFCQFLQRKSIQIGSISHTDQCVVRKYQTDGFDIVVIKNIRIESLIYRLLSLGITDTGGSIHDIGEIRLNDGIGQDPGRTGFHGLHSCRDEGRYIIQRLCIGSIQLTGIILGKKLNAHNKSKEHKKQCR